MQVARALSRFSSACAAFAALSTVGLALGQSGCFNTAEGLDPPSDEIYFPTNLVASPGGKVLYVTNSDFDLQYNGGTVQALDLDALRVKALGVVDALAAGVGVKACAEVGLAENSEGVLYPGPCGPLDVVPFVKASRTVGAFASGAVLVPSKTGLAARLFVSVRGDPSVTYFDVSDDRTPEGLAASCPDGGAFCLLCAASEDENRCGSDHIIGDDPAENTRRLTMPVEPIGIAASPDGEAIVTAHQTEQSASLVVNRWGARPTLEYYVTGLPFGPTEIAALPQPGVARASEGSIAWQPGFMVTFRAAAQLNMLRYYDDKEASPARGFLTRSAVTGISVDSRGTDSRGIAIDSSEREACEATCDAAGGAPDAIVACMRACLAIPLRLFAASRAPASLLIGEIRSDLAFRDGKASAVVEEAFIHDTVPLAFGASRVAVGRVIGEDGALHVRVFALAFDSRLVFVYDPAARRIESVIRTGRGPHAVAFDTGGEGASLHSFLYVGHFTDSYIGVVDLDKRNPQSFGSMILTVGVPTPPRGSK